MVVYFGHWCNTDLFQKMTGNGLKKMSTKTRTEKKPDTGYYEYKTYYKVVQIVYLVPNGPVIRGCTFFY